MTARAAMFGGILAALALVAGPASSQSPSAEAMAAAKELVVASRAGGQIKTLLPLIFQQLKPMIVQGRPEVARDFDKLMPLMLELMSSRMDEFADAMTLVYARNFTVAELQQIQAFYQTPAGQKLLDRMPVVAQESMALARKWVRRSPRICRTESSRSCASEATTFEARRGGSTCQGTS